jgi:hypothetical protein
MGKSPERLLSKLKNKPRDLKPRRSQCVPWASIRSWPFFGCGQSLPQSNHSERRSKLK